MYINAMQPKVLDSLGLKMWVNVNSPLPEIEQVITHIRQNSDHYFKEKIIKQDLATTVVEAKIGKQDIIIKRINPQDWVTVIRRLFCFSRLKRNWKFAHILAQQDIDTFIPLLLVNKQCFGINYVSYLYMTKIKGIEAIAYFEKCIDRTQWQPTADKIITLIKKLNTLGLRHRDLNLSNMIIGQDKVFLIDLDAMKYQKKVNSRFCKKEIDKFIENIEYLKQKNSELYHYFYHQLLSREKT